MTMEQRQDIRDSDRPIPQGGTEVMGRRTALGLIGGTLGALVLAGCGGGGSATGAATAAAATTDATTAGTTTTGTTTAGTTATAHAVTPEGEVGPYFTDDSASGYNRSAVTSSIDGTDTQAGVPLTLKVTVYDTESGNAPLAGAQVDLWHCNALGVYSSESSEDTLGQSWLRGCQISDADGLVTFTTIVPGWYQGRATHIHLRVRSKYDEASSASDGTNTTQVFFPQATLDALYTSVSPYSAKGLDTTTNLADHVYTPETEGETEVPLVGSAASGYAAAFSVYLPITSV